MRMRKHISPGVVLTSCAVGLIVSGIYLRSASASTTQSSTLSQCMEYSTSSAVAFDEAAAGTPAEPDCWKQITADNPEIFSALPARPAEGGTVLLLHGMTSPAGHVRLVCLLANNAPQGMQLSPLVIDCTVSSLTAIAAAVPMQIVNHPDLPMRIHFAQVDTKDASRFTLGVDYCGRPQKIDGQLQDDDGVTLMPTFGWVEPGGAWKVEDAPHRLQIKAPMKVMQLGYGARLDRVGSFLSKDGKLLAIRSDNAQKHSQIDLWDTETEKRISSWDAGDGFAWPRFSDDGTSITGLDNGRRIYYRFAIPSGKQLWQVDLSEVFTRPNSAHWFYMDGNLAAISSPDEGLVRLWDIKAHGQLIKRIHVPQEGQQNLTVSEDGKFLAFWQFAPGTKVLFFSPETGRLISRQDVNPGVEEFGFTADDRDFVEITDDGLVFVDVATGRIHFRRGSGPFWRGAKISASCNVIVSSTDGGFYNLPSADTYCELLLNGGAVSTNSLGVSGDGRCAVTQLDDGTWALWDLTAGK